MLDKNRNSLLVAILLTGAPLHAIAGIVGETLVIDWFYPDAATVFATSGPVVVTDPGPEWVDPQMNVTVDVADGSLLVENRTVGWAGSSGFNGLVITDFFGVIQDFTSFLLVSVSGGAPPVDPILSFTPDLLAINFNAGEQDNSGAGPGAVYRFSFATAPVPLPGALTLLVCGLAGAGWAGRHGKRAVPACVPPQASAGGMTGEPEQRATLLQPLPSLSAE